MFFSRVWKTKKICCRKEGVVRFRADDPFPPVGSCGPPRTPAASNMTTTPFVDIFAGTNPRRREHSALEPDHHYISPEGFISVFPWCWVFPGATLSTTSYQQFQVEILAFAHSQSITFKPLRFTVDMAYNFFDTHIYIQHVRDRADMLAAHQHLLHHSPTMDRLLPPPTYRPSL